MSIQEARAWIATLNNFQKALILGCMSAGAVALAIHIGGVLATGAIVSSIMVASAVFTIMRFNKSVRRFFLRHPVLTNLFATTAIATIVGVSSVTGLVTVAMSFLGIDIAQKLAGYMSNDINTESSIITLDQTNYRVHPARV